MRIGVGITTRNRPGVLMTALEHHLKHHRTTSEVELFYYLVNDSTEDIVAPWNTLMNLECWVWQPKKSGIHLGIARAKNLCLANLMREGCDHIFLFDDDAWPVADYWYEPFVNHHEPHLQACFPQGTFHSSPLIEYYRDKELVAYHRSRGYCLYYDRKVIERVGGMDERFQYGMEHLEHSRRIHNAGLTLFEHQDLLNSASLVYSCDSENARESPSVISVLDRHTHSASNLVLYQELANSSEFVDYEPGQPVVLTCLFTEQPDEQRNGKRWDPDPALAAGLLTSLDKYEVDFRVFYDNDEMVAGFTDADDRWVRVDTSISPYLQRWITYRQYLMDAPEHRWVWCVDATDVELLQDPWYGLKPGTLYCGWENAVCSRPWMLNFHSASREWLERNGDEMLLNPGVIGGDRHTVMQFCDNVIQCYVRGKTKGLVDEAGDMGYAQQAVRMMGNWFTGPAVTTLFKGYEPANRHAIWKHK